MSFSARPADLDGQFVYTAGRRMSTSSTTDATPRPRPTTATSTLSRKGTLLDANTPATAKQLKTILGSSTHRIKAGTKIRTINKNGAEEHTKLEQARARARVEVDLSLECNQFVQGGFIKGKIKVRARRRNRLESPVKIGHGKVRVIGYEEAHTKRSAFYQHSAPLDGISNSLHRMMADAPDENGFSEVLEGVHAVPFALQLPLDGDEAKGYITPHAGASIRYIVLVSFKIVDSATATMSIAHHYRHAQVFCRLSPAEVLSNDNRPLTATSSKSLLLGGESRAKLTASIRRLHWVSGQQVHVNITIANATKKLINALSIHLIRTTRVPSKTTAQRVAISQLEIGQASSKGHASAVGWWTGVLPGESSDVMHSITIPSDALTVVQSSLLEVEYTLRVSAGSLTSEVTVILPIRIVNFISLDPPSTSSLVIPSACRRSHTRRPIDSTIVDQEPFEGVQLRDEGVIQPLVLQVVNGTPSQDATMEQSGCPQKKSGTDVVDLDGLLASLSGRAPSFADLYYASLAPLQQEGEIPAVPEASPVVVGPSPVLPSAPGRPRRPTPGPRAPSSFMKRVEEKMQARAPTQEVPLPTNITQLQPTAQTSLPGSTISVKQPPGSRLLPKIPTFTTLTVSQLDSSSIAREGLPGLPSETMNALGIFTTSSVIPVECDSPHLETSPSEEALIAAALAAATSAGSPSPAAIESDEIRSKEPSSLDADSVLPQPTGSLRIVKLPTQSTKMSTSSRSQSPVAPAPAVGLAPNRPRPRLPQSIGSGSSARSPYCLDAPQGPAALTGLATLRALPNAPVVKALSTRISLPAQGLPKPKPATDHLTATAASESPVKRKIRELEEKMKAERFVQDVKLESSGPL